MHVVVIDPGFEDFNSHHATVNDSLLFHFQENGLQLTVLAAKKLDRSITSNLKPQCISYFTVPCYTNNLKPLPKEKEQQLAESFADELADAFNGRLINLDSILVLHTFFSFHLLGLAIWLQRLNAPFKGGVLLCGMFFPGKLLVNSPEEFIEFEKVVRFKLAAKYLTSLLQPSQLLVATSCQRFIGAYK